MKKFFFLIFLDVIISSSLHSQLAVLKMVGKNANNYSAGIGVFAWYDIPLNEAGNKSFMLEILDLGYFIAKKNYPGKDRAYLSIKVGYRYIFSEETKTGFYIEPQAGYCRVALGNGSYGDGFAVAAEAGYSLEVGQNGNTMVFGLKYEADVAGTDKTIQAVGLRVGYSFHLFRKRRND